LIIINEAGIEASACARKLRLRLRCFDGVVDLLVGLTRR